MTTRQEFFDTTVFKMLEQGEPSWCPDEGCVYLTRTNLKCAVGHWIPDSEYNENIEGVGVGSVNIDELSPTIAKLKREVGVDLMIGMQNAHDICADQTITDWKSEFIVRVRDLADELSLDTGVLDANMVS